VQESVCRCFLRFLGAIVRLARRRGVRSKAALTRGPRNKAPGAFAVCEIHAFASGRMRATTAAWEFCNSGNISAVVYTMHFSNILEGERGGTARLFLRRWTHRRRRKSFLTTVTFEKDVTASEAARRARESSEVCKSSVQPVW
jgi:hypothetical protein